MSRRLLVNDLLPATNYALQVRAVNPTTQSPWSIRYLITTVSDTDNPATPTGLTWTSTGTTFYAEWVPVTLTVGNKPSAVQRYELELTAAGQTKVVPIPQATGAAKVAYSLTYEQNRSLFGTAQAIIVARVRAIDNKDFKGAYTNTVSATNPSPAAPTALTATPSLNAINLTWTAAADTDLTGYNVYVGATKIGYVSGTNFTYSTTNYSSTTMTVKSVDIFGQESTAVNATATPVSPFTSDTTAPGSPTGLTASITTDSFARSSAAVSWTMTSPPTDLQGFQVRYRKVGDTNWLQSNAGYDDRTMVVSIPLPYVNYEFQIRAFDFSANFSAWTASATATGATNAAPAQVAGLALAAGQNAITASWTENSEDDVRNGAGLYEVQYATNVGFTTGLLTYRTGAPQITVTGLANNTQYFVRVRAVDSVGQTGTYSTTSNATTTIAPITSLSDGLAPTTSPTPTIVPGVGILNVSWIPVANADLVTYEVHISTTTGFTPAAGTKVAEIAGTSILLRNTATNVALTYGTTYYVRIIAKDRDGAAAAGTQASGIPLKAGATDITLTPADIGAVTTTQFNTAIKTYATEYSVNASESVAPTTGWSTTTPTRTPGTFVWTRVTVTYQDNTTSTTNPALLTGNTGATGSQGIPGTPGANGVSLYTWLKYADTPTTGMSDSPTGKTYMGIATNQASATESNVYSDYQWSLIQGPQGNQGIPGTPGANGVTTYTWVKYADTATGTNMSDLPTGKTYIGLSFNQTNATESNLATDYQWSLIQGPQGPQGSPGIQGPVGPNGQTLYTWLKYADTPTTGMSDFPTGKTYMGIAVNQTSPTESNLYSDYTWSLIQGPQGNQGIAGTPGANGQTTYTWVKYADDASGTNISDLPTGKTYIGLSFNQTNQTESNLATDYQWSLIQGPQGVQGLPGAPAAVVSLTATTQVLTSPATGGATNPATSVVTGVGTNTTITAWTYSVDGAAFSATVPAGVSRTANVVTITGSTMTARTIAVRMADANGVADTLTVAKVVDGATGATGGTGAPGTPGVAGADAYTVLLSNEAQTFAAGTTNAQAATATATVIAYKQTVQQPATVGTITGGATGITAAVTNNGTTAPLITFTVTTALTTPNGTFTIPVTVGGITFNQIFTWSLAFTGTTGATGTPGAPGAPAANIILTSTSQVLALPAGGSTTNPATATVTGTAANTTITAWTYSVDGAAFSATVPAGVSRTGNVVTITGSTMTARTITVQMADANGIADTMTVAKVSDGATGATGGTGAPGTPGTAGADAFTVLLTNEAQTFAGSTTAALAGSATTSILAYKAAVQQTATIGTITGQVTGLTTAITNNGTTNPTVTVTVTTAMTTPNGTLTIPVTVGGIVFTKLFSWSLSLQGTTGATGNTGNPGATGATGLGISSVTPYFNQTTSGAAAPATPTASPPPAPWTNTEPGYVANTDLWRTERILFTDSTFTYTTVNKASAYTAAVTAITTANGKNKVTFSTTPTVPGTTANTAGDVWYVRDATGNIISIYEGGGGTTWTLRPLTDAVLSSVTAAKITTGTLGAITITVPSTGAIQSADYAAGSTGFLLKSGSLEIRSGVIAANTIVSGTGIVNNLIVNTGGGIQSSVYTAGTTGFRISNAGIELNDANSKVSASTFTAGTISATTISVGVGGTLSVDGSTGQIKSNNYAANSTGYRLSNAGLEVNDGTIDAKALKTGSAIVGDLVIGRTADALGSIQSFGYVAGTTGFRLDKTGLTVNTGTIKAAALQLQFGENLMPPQFAAWEYPNSFYTTGMFVSQGSMIRSTSPTSKIGTQSYGTLWGVQASDPILYMGTSTTDYNILVTAGTPYIFSAYFWCAGTVATTIQFKVKWSTGAISTIATQALPASGTPATSIRVSGAVTAPAGATGAVLLVDATTLTANAGYNIDAVQVETQWSSQTTPSPWSPPGYTRIDGGIIRTGTIQSNVTGLVWNDTTQAFVNDPTGAPSWSINTNGAATFNNLAVNGSVVVGTIGDVTTAMPSISSANYEPGNTGWMIRSDGTSEFRQMVSESILGDAIAANSMTADRLVASTIVSDLSLAGRLISPTNIRSVTLSTTVNSALITSTVANTFVTTDVGATVTGPGIPAGAKVTAYNSGTSITVNVLATATGTNVAGQVASGRAVSIAGDTGIQVLDTDGVTPLVSIPTDATQPNVFSGQLFADALTVYDNFQMRGTNNSLLAGTSLTLNAQQGTPATAPSVAQSWTGYQSWTDGKNFSSGMYGFNYDPVANEYLSANNFFGTQLFKFAADGSFISNTTLPKGPEANASDFSMLGGMVKVGTSYYGIGKLSTNNTWWLRQYNATLTTMTNNWAFTAINGTKRPAIGYDPSTNNLLVARCDSSGILKMSTHSTTNGAAIGGVLPTDLTPNTDITAIATGSFDMGAQFYIVQGTNSATYGKTNYVFTYNGVPPATQVKARSFPTANNAYQIGLCWNGTKFKSMSSTGLISEYTSIADNVSNLSWHAKSTWYQTTGNYETTMSSQVDFNMQRRAKLTLSTSAIPNSGSASDANSVRFYVSTATTGTSSNFFRQTGPGIGVTSLALTAAPAASTSTTSGIAFPLATPSSIVSSNGLLRLSSDGTAVFGSTQDANTSSGNLPALRTGDPAGTHLRIDGNEILAMGGPATQDILYLNRGGNVQMGNKTWQQGTKVVTMPTGGGQTTVTVTFPTPFLNPPIVMGQPITGAGNTVTVNWWFGTITTTGCNLTVARSNSTDTTIQWLAIDM